MVRKIIGSQSFHYTTKMRTENEWASSYTYIIQRIYKMMVRETMLTLLFKRFDLIMHWREFYDRNIFIWFLKTFSLHGKMLTIFCASRMITFSGKSNKMHCISDLYFTLGVNIRICRLSLSKSYFISSNSHNILCWLAGRSSQK